MNNLYQRNICSGKFLYNISILRIIAMLMVIFYHSFYCYVGWENTIYSASISVGLWTIMSSFFSHIHVPTFLFLAGYLYAYKRFDLNSYPSKSSYLKNRIKRIGVPYLLWGGGYFDDSSRSSSVSIFRWNSSFVVFTPNCRV